MVDLFRILVVVFMVMHGMVHVVWFVALARILGSSADELLCIKPSKDNGMPKDRRFLQRLPKIDKLSKQDRQTLLSIIDTFVAKAP